MAYFYLTYTIIICYSIHDMNTDTYFSASPATESREEQLRQFKSEVKEWMREHRIKASDIASWTEKSVGTVKNWLYTPLNITNENQQLIRNFMEQYERGFVCVSGDSINREAPFKSIGFIPVKLQELDLSDCAPEYWCMAAEVRTDLLNNSEGVLSLQEAHIVFAKWFTELIMKRTREVIAPVYKDVLSNGKKFELNRYINESPSTMEPYFSGFRVDCVSNSERYVPVIIEQWKPTYLLAAAGICNQTAGQFILSTLQDATEQMNDTNLRAFLEEDINLESVPCSGFYRV